MFQVQREKYPYRKAVLGIVVDDNRQFLIVQKLSYRENEWSFTGGGVDNNESPDQAVLRELKEELGSEKFAIVAKSKITYRYDWPEQVILERFDKKGELFRGQEIIYFLVKFIGEQSELKKQETEIRIIKWVSLGDLPKHLIFPNQWQSAETVIKELLPF